MDKLSAERRSRNMAQIRSANTGPEIAVRRVIHGMGYRYGLHGTRLPGKPDIVLTSRKKVVFVHGCFWHQHPKITCKDSRIPKSRQHYWQPKLARTALRDVEHRRSLSRLGWQSLVVWECELTAPSKLAVRLRRFLEK